MKLEDYLELADRTGIVPFFWGDPGVGKTARIEQWAKAKGYHLERLVLSQHDPTEVAGIYVASEGARRAERAVPARLARVLEVAKRGRRAVLFFDELTTAAPTVQDTALGIFNERVVGDVPLPEGVILLAAANPPDRVDGLWELSAALANRFLHVEVRPDFQSWRAWAEEQGEAHRRAQGTKTPALGPSKKSPHTPNPLQALTLSKAGVAGPSLKEGVGSPPRATSGRHIRQLWPSQWPLPRAGAQVRTCAKAASSVANLRCAAGAARPTISTAA